MPWRCGRCWPDCPAGRPGVSPALLHYSLFTLTFFGNKALTCRLVRDAPPSSSSPCGEEEERRARWRRRRGLGCELSQYRASIRCFFAKRQAWCRLAQTCMAPASLSAAAGLVRAGTLQSPVSTGPAAAVGDAEASQVCTKFAHDSHLVQGHLVEARVHLRLHQSLFFSSTPGRSSSSPRRRRGGGRILDKTASYCLVGKKSKSE